MKLWPWRRKKRHAASSTELAVAEEAREQSERALRAAQRMTPAVTELARALATRRQVNHFAESIRAEWGRHR